MNTKPITYGVVGLGRAGWNIHIVQLRDRLDARIVTVVDPDGERRKEAVQEFGCPGELPPLHTLNQKSKSRPPTGRRWRGVAG